MVTVAAGAGVTSCPTAKLLVLSVDDMTHTDVTKSFGQMMSERLILLHRHLGI